MARKSALFGAADDYAETSEPGRQPQDGGSPDPLEELVRIMEENSRNGRQTPEPVETQTAYPPEPRQPAREADIEQDFVDAISPSSDPFAPADDWLQTGARPAEADPLADLNFNDEFDFGGLSDDRLQDELAQLPELEDVAEPVSAASSPQHSGQDDLGEDAILAAMDDIERHESLAASNDVPARAPAPDPFEASDKASFVKTAVMGLGAVALLGLGGIFVYGLLISGGNGDGQPQIISANEDPIRVIPAEEAANEPQPGDEAFASLDGSTANEEPRVVLPGPGPVSSDEIAEAGAQVAPPRPGTADARPVRTVVVRADGTVVSTQESPAADDAAAQTIELATSASPARPVEVVPVVPEPTPGAAANAVEQAITDGIAAAETVVEETVEETVAAQPTADAPPAPVVRPESLPAAAPVATQPAAAPATPTADNGQPLSLAAPQQPVAPPATQTAPAATEVAAAPVPTSGFVVQLASLRTEDQAQATFSQLQSRFGSILGGLSPNITRVDLGERGIFHRVRVGPMDRAAADSLCQRYQSAGGDCFVQRL